jgi:hypothetical protein
MWWKSVRSIVTLMVSGSFCYLAVIGKVETAIFMGVVILVFNYYFLSKERSKML